MTRCLQLGADTDGRNELGGTPLHLAAMGGTAEAVMALLEVAGSAETPRGESGFPGYCGNFRCPPS